MTGEIPVLVTLGGRDVVHAPIPFRSIRFADFGDMRGIGAGPDRIAKTEEHVRAHRCPGENFEIVIGKVPGDFALVAGIAKPRGDARRGRFIMLAIGLGFDEFRFVDDAIDVAMLARELEESLERAALAVEGVGRVLDRRRDIVADLRRHVADDRSEHRLF